MRRGWQRALEVFTSHLAPSYLRARVSALSRSEGAFDLQVRIFRACGSMRNTTDEL